VAAGLGISAAAAAQRINRLANVLAPRAKLTQEQAIEKLASLPPMLSLALHANNPLEQARVLIPQVRPAPSAPSAAAATTTETATKS
jgi:hypothetical protein